MDCQVNHTKNFATVLCNYVDMITPKEEALFSLFVHKTERTYAYIQSSRREGYGNRERKTETARGRKEGSERWCPHALNGVVVTLVDLTPAWTHLLLSLSSTLPSCD